MYKPKVRRDEVISLDKRDETIRAIKEQLHSLYKELYKAGIIQKGNQVTRDYYSAAEIVEGKPILFLDAYGIASPLWVPHPLNI